MIPAALLLSLLSASCQSDRSCASVSDCFQGEACVDGLCVEATNSSAPDADNSSGPDQTADGGHNGETPDAAAPRDGAPPDANQTAAACVIDPFGHTCDDDPHEPNEGNAGFAPLLFDNQSWCDGTTLNPTQTSEPLRLCAGDTADVFRLMIDNRVPTNCLTQQFTWRVEVRFDAPCEHLDVKPYYSNSFTEDRCNDDDNFRCSWSADGLVFRIDELRQPEQIMDLNLKIAPRDARNDIETGYDVTMTIIQ